MYRARLVAFGHRDKKPQDLQWNPRMSCLTPLGAKIKVVLYLICLGTRWWSSLKCIHHLSIVFYREDVCFSGRSLATPQDSMGFRRLVALVGWRRLGSGGAVASPEPRLHKAFEGMVRCGQILQGLIESSQCNCCWPMICRFWPASKLTSPL